MRTFILSFSILLACASGVDAQEQKELLRSINSQLDGTVVLSVDAQHHLIAEHFRNGNGIRKDMAYTEYLDPGSISYDAKQRLLEIGCISKEPECVDKEIYKSGTIWPIATMRIRVPASARGQEVAEQLKELILDDQR